MNGTLLDSSKFTLTATSATTFDLTIDDTINYVENGDTVKVLYNAPEGDAALLDNDGNLISDFNQTVTTTATTFVQDIAEVSSLASSPGGDVITLTFDEDVNTAGGAATVSYTHLTLPTTNSV